MNIELFIQLGYVVAAGLFIFGLKMLGSPDTARRGNGISAIGMLVAIVAALLDQGCLRHVAVIIVDVVNNQLVGVRCANIVTGKVRTTMNQVLDIDWLSCDETCFLCITE